ncbi:MAG: DNA cytosine methyltransferase, partial [bacterium]
DLLCAADFGAPQLRNRLVFIGVRNPYPAVPLPKPTHAQCPTGAEKPYVGIGDAFKGLPVVPLSGETLVQATLSIAERRARYSRPKKQKRVS